MYHEPLPFQFLNGCSNRELLDIERECIATQDTRTLATIARIKQSRIASSDHGQGFPENCL